MATAAAPRASTESSEPSLPAEPQPTRARLQRLVPPLFLVPAMALYSLFVLWPIARVAWLSLFQWSGLGSRHFIGFANFTSLWQDQLFRSSVEHLVIWELGALIAPTLIGLGLALLLRRSAMRAVILTVLFFPVLLPATVVAATWGLVYSPVSGLLNTALREVQLSGLAHAWLGDPHLALTALFVAWLWSAVGVSVLVLWSGLLSIGREWTEIAVLEGAGRLRQIRYVILPGLRRPIALTLLIDAALAGAVFDLIFVTTSGGPGYATMIVPLEVYGRAFGGHAGQGAAAACMQIALGLLLACVTGVLVRIHQESLDTGSPPAIGRTSRLSTIAACVAAVAVLLPLLWLVPVALEPGRSFAIQGPTFDPGSWRLGNIKAAWDAGMASAVGSSLAIALCVVTGTLLLAAPAAFALASGYAGPWRIPIGGLLLIGLFQSTPALLIPLFTLLSDLGLLDTLWGVILPEIARALPFAILALWAFLAGTPREILDAAEIDGASPLRQMLAIALPLAQPALIAVAVWTFATSWNEYLLPILVSQDNTIQTVPTLLAGFIGKYNTQLGILAAGSLLATLPSLLIYLILRHPAAAGLARAEQSIR